MNKTNDCLKIGSYVCSLNCELFLHTDKKHLKAEKHLHFDFVSYIDLESSCKKMK